jgi:hypothetical protein
MANEKITTAGAIGAVATPWWLPSLNEVSQVCATLAPILGVVWLVFQFVLKVRELRKT